MNFDFIKTDFPKDTVNRVKCRILSPHHITQLYKRFASVRTSVLKSIQLATLYSPLQKVQI